MPPGSVPPEAASTPASPRAATSDLDDETSAALEGDHPADQDASGREGDDLPGAEGDRESPDESVTVREESRALDGGEACTWGHAP